MRVAAFLTELLRRPVQVCATIAGALAVLSLWSWASGDWRVLAFGPDFVPMAPSSACSILLLSCGLVLHSQWPSKTLARATAYFAAIGVSLLGLLVWMQWIGGFELPFGGWLANTTDRVANIPVGRMSPLSGMALLLAALAFLLELPPLGSRWWCRQVAAVLGLATLSISIVVLASYAAGMPLLYGTHTIPVALLTALSFLPLALGLLAAAGADTLPLSLFQSGAKVGSRPSQGWVVGAPLLIFLLLSAGIGTVGYAYFRHQIVRAREDAQADLSAIVDLKVRSIVDWREERLSDAQTVMLDEFLGQQVREFLDPVPNPEARATMPPRLLARLRSIREHNQGLRAVLLDPQMNVRLASPKDNVYFGPIAQTFAVESLQSNRVVMSDLHRSRFTGEIHLDLAIPLSDRLASPGAGAPLGVIVVEVDPNKFIYPQIQRWPTLSLSGETLLIRREGDEVLYLNELRHKSGTALTLRVPIGKTDVPAVRAALGHEGVVEGVDYRKVPVLAAMRSIPGTHWCIVAKMDQEEIYAPLREQALTTGALVLVFVVLAALGVGLMGRWRDARWLRSRLDLEREHRLILDSTDEGILGLDRYGRHVFVNPAACRMLGYAHDELIGKTSHTIWHSKKANGTPYPLQECPILTVLKTWKPCCSNEDVFWKKDGTSFPAEFIATPSLEKDRSVAVVLLFRDITERKQAEDDLLQTKAELQQYAATLEFSHHAAEAANRAKSEFLANMSHEIRTPMTAILGYAELIAEENVVPTTQSYIEVIQRNGKHLMGVINDILDLSKIEAEKLQIEPTCCSPFELVAEVVSLMRVRADAKHLKLETDLAGPLPETVLTDPLRLRQILVNLLGNAIKFTEQGEVRLAVRLCKGTVPFSSDENRDSPPVAPFSSDENRKGDSPIFVGRKLGQSPDLRLCFDVTDTGIGMNEEQIGKLFKPFSQVDNSATRKYGGTGLGLCISKKLSEALGGDIEVRSEPGKGSTFSVTIDPGPLDGIRMIQNAQEANKDLADGWGRHSCLPLADKNVCPTGPAIPEKIVLHGRVLLAEDGEDNQIMICFLLKRAGAEVVAVENGQLALDAVLAASEAGQPFDLILMDMQMPVLNGYEATRQLREQGYTGPIVALTAHSLVTDCQKCLDAGCDDYQPKPFQHQDLLKMAARHITAEKPQAGTLIFANCR